MFAMNTIHAKSFMNKCQTFKFIQNERISNDHLSLHRRINGTTIMRGQRQQQQQGSARRTMSFTSKGRALKCRAGIVEDVQRAIKQNKEALKRKEEQKYQSPEGVPKPPIVPVIEQGKFGWVDNAETMNSRASMIGWWSLLIVEFCAGKGLLEIFGVQVGKGINFTF